MALTGIQVSCSKVVTFNNVSLRGTTPDDWSENAPLTAAYTTTRATPSGGPSIVRMIASVDFWYAVGPAPNASNATGDGQTAREYVAANTREEIWVQAGHKIAFVAA